MNTGRAGPRLAAEEGQAVIESAWLLAILLLGAAALGWPFLERLVEAWQAHDAAVHFVVDGPFP